MATRPICILFVWDEEPIKGFYPWHDGGRFSSWNHNQETNERDILYYKIYFHWSHLREVWEMKARYPDQGQSQMEVIGCTSQPTLQCLCSCLCLGVGARSWNCSWLWLPRHEKVMSVYLLILMQTVNLYIVCRSRMVIVSQLDKFALGVRGIYEYCFANTLLHVFWIPINMFGSHRVDLKN